MMFVIPAYDVRQKRQNKTRKICKKYLYYIQQSVYEGYLTEKQLFRLKCELSDVIDPDEDSLCIYKIPYYRNIRKEELGFSTMNDMEVL